MKILHVGDIAFVGSTLARELRRRGHEVTVVSKRHGALSGRSEDFLRYSNSAWGELTLNGIDVNKFDIIHNHYLINWSSLGLSWKKTKRPVLHHCHGCDTRPKNFIERSIQRRVIGNNKLLLYSTPDLLENIQWFKGRRIYLPNPVNGEYAKAYQGSSHDRILIFGTMYCVKQTERLFPLIKDLPYTFDILDIGPYRHVMEKLAPKNVCFIKPVSHDEVPALLCRYPLILGASQDGTVRKSELEAMALGIPTLFPFKYHEFYPEKLSMPQDWQQEIGSYLNDCALGERQRQWVELYHGVRPVVDELIKIYERVLN